MEKKLLEKLFSFNKITIENKEEPKDSFIKFHPGYKKRDPAVQRRSDKSAKTHLSSRNGQKDHRVQKTRRRVKKEKVRRCD